MKMNLVAAGLIAMSGIVFFKAASAATETWKIYSAVTFTDIKTETADDGFTKTISVSFSGVGLKPFMALLPKVRDDEQSGKIEEGHRRLEVSNMGQTGIAIDRATSLTLDCDTFSSKIPTCSLYLVHGVIPD